MPWKNKRLLRSTNSHNFLFSLVQPAQLTLAIFEKTFVATPQPRIQLVIYIYALRLRGGLVMVQQTVAR